MFGRKLYDNDETYVFHSRNPVSHILTSFWGDKFLFLDCSWLFKSSCIDASDLDIGPILYFFAVQIQEQKLYDAHCKTVHWSGHGITHMRLWPSMMMQCIRAKQAEEKWSLHQYNFLAGSCKTVQLAFRSKDWIKFQHKTVADFRLW